MRRRIILPSPLLRSFADSSWSRSASVWACAIKRFIASCRVSSSARYGIMLAGTGLLGKRTRQIGRPQLLMALAKSRAMWSKANSCAGMLSVATSARRDQSKHRPVRRYCVKMIAFGARAGSKREDLDWAVVRGDRQRMSMATENCTLLTIENQTLQTCGRTPRRGVGGVWLGVAVGNRVGAATATESGGDNPVTHSGRAAPFLSPFWPAITTHPSCGFDPRRPAAGSGDPSSGRSCPGC